MPYYKERKIIHPNQNQHHPQIIPGSVGRASSPNKHMCPSYNPLIHHNKNAPACMGYSHEFQQQARYINCNGNQNFMLGGAVSPRLSMFKRQSQDNQIQKEHITRHQHQIMLQNNQVPFEGGKHIKNMNLNLASTTSAANSECLNPLTPNKDASRFSMQRGNSQFRHKSSSRGNPHIMGRTNDYWPHSSRQLSLI
eukprot:GHVL01038124.1.p1 GENE.GHVL01038124.1~~GHVL01038124.1.p1  ORF type:complete len:195 (-),score=12.92 GHVL01038124.1:314-898(-)